MPMCVRALQRRCGDRRGGAGEVILAVAVASEQLGTNQATSSGSLLLFCIESAAVEDDLRRRCWL